MDVELDCKRYRRPFRRPLRTAHGSWEVREGLLLRARWASGATTYGEVAPVPWFGTETIDEAEAFFRSRMGRVPDLGGVQAPVECPCCQFALSCLRRDSDPQVSATPSVIARLLPAGSEGLSQLRAALDEGFLSFKWKIGVDLVDVELALLRQLVEELPPEGTLRLDANGALDHAAAQRWLAAINDLPAGRVEYLEQPLPPGQESAMSALGDRFATPIALDESVAQQRDFDRLESTGWKGLYVIKPAIFGSLEALREVVEQVRPEQVVISSVFESAIARRAILAALPVGQMRAFGFDTARQLDRPELSEVADEVVWERAASG